MYYIGKPRDAHANAIATEFLKRSSRYSDCEMREVVPKRFDVFARHPAARKILLDPAGREHGFGGLPEAGETGRAREPGSGVREWAVTMDCRRNGRGAGTCCSRFLP